MKWKVSFAALVVVLGAFFFFKREISLQPVGQELPMAREFSLPDAAGNQVKFTSFKGSVVFLHFWAEWCPPCIEEIPHLIAFAKKHQSKPIKIVAISLDPSWEDARKVMDSKDLPSNVISLLDSEQKVSNLYGSFEYPETYFIDKEQKIVHKWIGPQNWENPQFERMMAEYF